MNKVFEITKFREEFTKDLRVYEVEDLYRSYCNINNMDESLDDSYEMFDHSFLGFISYYDEISKVAII
jgi:hypothetical protein